MLGWVVAGTGVALSPRSVLSTFPDKKRLWSARCRQARTGLKG